MTEPSPSLGPPHPWVVDSGPAARFSLFAGPSADWSALRDFVQMGESLGFDAYWTSDHPIVSPADCWTVLAALAVSTTRIRLGPLVNCVFYRHPALLARQAADVDRLSDGRLVLGLGSGSIMSEFDKFGFPQPSRRDRGQALEESILIVHGVWGAEPFSYHGQHFRVQAAQVKPGPVQQPRVALLIAGGSGQTLRLAARYADAVNLGGHPTTGGAVTIDDVRAKLTRLRHYCAEVGRPYEAILRTGFALPVLCAATPDAVRAKLDAIPSATRDFLAPCLVAGTPLELVRYFQTLIDAGLQYFTVGIRGNDVETVRLLAEQVIPAMRPTAMDVST